MVLVQRSRIDVQRDVQPSSSRTGATDGAHPALRGHRTRLPCPLLGAVCATLRIPGSERLLHRYLEAGRRSEHVPQIHPPDIRKVCVEHDMEPHQPRGDYLNGYSQNMLDPHVRVRKGGRAKTRSSGALSISARPTACETSSSTQAQT